MVTDLKLEDGRKLKYNEEYLRDSIDELSKLLQGERQLKTLKFAKKVMLPYEIKYNISIEGINRDITTIEKELKSKSVSDAVINLYKGYKYILQGHDINKESLKDLNLIISNNILSKEDKKEMGEYYRIVPVYITNKIGPIDIPKQNSLSRPDMGMDHTKLDYYMDMLFEYINTDDVKNEIDVLLKSQIIHFYFVYVHPYIDTNGRTSRTLAMWYMLNNKVYPYLIFNRAISFTKSDYYRRILHTRQTGNITLYLKYLLDAIERELEKELLIESIGSNVKEFTTQDEQMLEYLLSINGNHTAKDLINMHNVHNEKQKPMQVFDEKIKPLIDKEILLQGRTTKSYINSDLPNFFVSINPKVVDIDLDKIKKLQY